MTKRLRCDRIALCIDDGGLPYPGRATWVSTRLARLVTAIRMAHPSVRFERIPFPPTPERARRYDHVLISTPRPQMLTRRYFEQAPNSLLVLEYGQRMHRYRFGDFAIAAPIMTVDSARLLLRDARRCRPWIRLLPSQDIRTLTSVLPPDIEASLWRDCVVVDWGEWRRIPPGDIAHLQRHAGHRPILEDSPAASAARSTWPRALHVRNRAWAGDPLAPLLPIFDYASPRPDVAIVWHVSVVPPTRVAENVVCGAHMVLCHTPEALEWAQEHLSGTDLPLATAWPHGSNPFVAPPAALRDLSRAPWQWPRRQSAVFGASNSDADLACMPLWEAIDYALRAHHIVVTRWSWQLPVLLATVVPAGVEVQSSLPSVNRLVMELGRLRGTEQGRLEFAQVAHLCSSQSKRRAVAA